MTPEKLELVRVLEGCACGGELTVRLLLSQQGVLVAAGGLTLTTTAWTTLSLFASSYVFCSQRFLSSPLFYFWD